MKRSTIACSTFFLSLGRAIAANDPVTVPSGCTRTWYGPELPIGFAMMNTPNDPLTCRGAGQPLKIGEPECGPGRCSGWFGGRRLRLLRPDDPNPLEQFREV